MSKDFITQVGDRIKELEELNAELLRLIRELLLYAPGDQLRADIKAILAKAEAMTSQQISGAFPTRLGIAKAEALE